MLHLLIFAGLFAILVAALVGNRTALVALAALVMIGATPFLLLFAFTRFPDGHDMQWLIWPFIGGWWGVIALGRWASNG
jgi:hypothetical protein